MISIQDDIIRWINDLSHDELRVYLVVNRYITEDEEILWYKIIQILSISDILLLEVLDSLVEKGLLGFVEQGKDVWIVDVLSGRKTLISGPKKSGKAFINLSLKFTKKGSSPIAYIYTNPQKEQTKKTSKKINKKKETVPRGVPDSRWPDSRSFQVKFESVIGKINNQARESGARQLVGYFTTKLFDLTGVSRSQRWRHSQLSVAKRLLKEHPLTLSEWQEAIDFFISQDFWKDKLNSLLQVEKNLQQWAYQKKKKPRKGPSIEFERL